MKIKILSLLSILSIAIKISTCSSDLSISKINKDILIDFEKHHPAKILNSTHFSCDNGTNILNLKNFNDDFCDCQDGADENSNLLIILFVFFFIIINL